MKMTLANRTPNQRLDKQNLNLLLYWGMLNVLIMDFTHFKQTLF